MKKDSSGDSSGAGQSVRKLSFPRLLNARDLGGRLTRDGLRTRERSLLRTDDLWKLTPAGARAILAYGVTTVIDLRWPEELDVRPSVFQRGASGVRYTHVSLLDGSEAAWSSKTPAVPKERWNCVALDHAGPEIAEVLRLVADSSEGVVVFHCAAGKDRTGLIAAMLLAIADVVPSEIAEDYSLSTEYIRDAYLAAHPRERWPAILEDIRCPPEQVYNMLAHLDAKYGGAAGYLRRAGLSAAELDRIRSRLRHPEARGG
jgi:protein-tyrosine phosphatase